MQEQVNRKMATYCETERHEDYRQQSHDHTPVIRHIFTRSVKHSVHSMFSIATAYTNCAAILTGSNTDHACPSICLSHMSSKLKSNKAHKTCDSISSSCSQIVLVSWSVSNHFVAIHRWSVHRSWKSQKNTKTPYFTGSRSFKVIDVNTAKKLITSACYDKQHAYTYLHLFSC